MHTYLPCRQPVEQEQYHHLTAASLVTLCQASPGGKQVLLSKSLSIKGTTRAILLNQKYLLIFNENQYKRMQMSCLLVVVNSFFVMAFHESHVVDTECMYVCVCVYMDD